MNKLLASIQKEMLILLRDRGGLAILFLMPMAMIIIMAIIQDAPFRDYQELKIPLLLVNNDKGDLGKMIEEKLKDSKIFVVTKLQLSDDEATAKIKNSEYEIGIIIPPLASNLLDAKISQFVTNKLSQAGLESTLPVDETMVSKELNLVILFEPETKKSFKASVLSTLKLSTSKLETQSLLDFFTKTLAQQTDSVKPNVPMENFVNFNERSTVTAPKEALLLNSVQHNVPAWTIFGMFFIVISMSGSMIKEREDGSYMRILTMPGSYLTLITGKIIAYLFICLLQCVLMLLVGLFLLQHLGLPALVIGNNSLAIMAIAISTGLAATGYGILVGTLFSTQQQSATFGAVSIVILAALGGIWVPVYVMPESVRFFAEISPLYWSLSAFHQVFLGEGNLQAIAAFTIKLILFFLLTIGAAYYYNSTANKH